MSPYHILKLNTSLNLFSRRDMEIYDMQGVKMNFYRPNY